jgi:hypothetical protein
LPLTVSVALPLSGTWPLTVTPGTNSTWRMSKPFDAAVACPERRPATLAPAGVTRPAASSSPRNCRRTSRTVAETAATVLSAFVRPARRLRRVGATGVGAMIGLGLAHGATGCPAKNAARPAFAQPLASLLNTECPM